MGLLHKLRVDALRFLERLKEASGDPRVAVEDLLLDYDGVHDGKDAGLFVVGLFFFFDFREKTFDGSSSL